MKILKRCLKILLGIIILFLILAVLGYFALTRWINPNIFKPQIIALVQKDAGRSLTLTGDLSWTFFPNIGIHIGEAALSNPAGFSQPTFAEFNSANLFINLSALLHGKVRVESLLVNGLQVYLMNSDTGQNNWTFSMPTATTNTGENQNQIDFQMKELILNNATVTYDNLQSTTHYVLSNFDLEIPRVRFDQPMEVKGTGDFSDQDVFTTHFKLDTGVFYDPNQNTLQLDHLALENNATYTTDQGESVPLALTVDAGALYDVDKNTLALSNLVLNTNTSYVMSKDQKFPIALSLSGNVNADLSHQSLTLSSIQFDLNQVLSGQLTLTVQNFMNPAYSGSLNLPTFALEPVLNSFGQTLPNIPNKTQFSQTRIQSSFAGTLNKLSLQNLNVGVGNTTLQGKLNITSFTPFAANENLSINQLDLADFVNLSGARLPLSGIALSGNVSAAGFAPPDFPSTLNASQKVSVQDIILKGFDLGAVLNQVSVILQNILNVEKISEAKAAIQSEVSELQQTTINADNGKQTDFGQLSSTVLVHNGVVTTPGMAVTGPLLAVTGQGEVDLNKQTIDYHLNAKVLSIDKNIIKTLNIPYNLTGPFNNMTQGVDFDSVESQIAQFIVGQIGQTVKSVVTTVVGAPVTVVTTVGKGAMSAVGGVGKGISGAFGSIFCGHKQAAGS